MPLFIDILENKVLGREFKRSKQEGIQQGIDKGIHEGQLAMLCQQITARFGVLPAWPGSAWPAGRRPRSRISACAYSRPDAWKNC